MTPATVDTSGWFTKDGNLILTGMSKTVGAALGLPGSFYHRDMAMRDADMPILAPVCKEFEQEDYRVLKTGKTSRSGVALYLPMLGWSGYHCAKSLDDQGQIVGLTTHHSPESLFQGWAARLDFTTQTLPLGGGQVLTRRELITLHMFLHGWPRKKMSEKLYISVKAVEKRLTIIKAKLKVPDVACDTIQCYLISRGMCAFLMTKQDWFNTEALFQIYA